MLFFSRFITTTIRRPDRKEKSRTPKAAAHHPARTIRSEERRVGKESSNRWSAQAEDGIRDDLVTGVQTCALPIWLAMKVRSNGRLVNEQTEKLDQPLQSGYAFFLQVHYDDYSKAGSEREESDAESGGTSPGENH